MKMLFSTSGEQQPRHGSSSISSCRTHEDRATKERASSLRGLALLSVFFFAGSINLYVAEAARPAVPHLSAPGTTTLDGDLKKKLAELSEAQKEAICIAYIYNDRTKKFLDDKAFTVGEPAAKLRREIGDVIPRGFLRDESGLNCDVHLKTFVLEEKLQLSVRRLPAAGDHEMNTAFAEAHPFKVAQLLLEAVLQHRVADSAGPGWVGPVNKPKGLFAFQIKRDPNGKLPTSTASDGTSGVGPRGLLEDPAMNPSGVVLEEKGSSPKETLFAKAAPDLHQPPNLYTEDLQPQAGFRHHRARVPPPPGLTPQQGVRDRVPLPPGLVRKSGSPTRDVWDSQAFDRSK
ncbi:unnamed protein product [Amoebophrya sp. A120]|nr:unnamed protein product [Amoebophrya sp. A120]|eukprot:GSA120T00000955001.1